MALVPHHRRLVMASAALAAALVICGVLLGAKGFAGNLLADGVGTIVGIFVGLLLIDRLVEADRQARWSLVSAGTTQTLRDAIVRSALAAYLVLDAPRPPQADPAMMADAGALSVSLQHLARSLREDSEQLGPALDVAAVTESVLAPTRAIFEIALPRLLMVGTHPDLVTQVVAVEHSARTLDYNSWMSDRFGLPGAALLQGVAELIDAYASLTDRLEE